MNTNNEEMNKRIDSNNLDIKPMAILDKDMKTSNEECIHEWEAIGQTAVVIPLGGRYGYKSRTVATIFCTKCGEIRSKVV